MVTESVCGAIRMLRRRLTTLGSKGIASHAQAETTHHFGKLLNKHEGSTSHVNWQNDHQKANYCGARRDATKTAKLLEQDNIGTVVVTVDGRPTGVVTDRDLALARCVHRTSPDDLIGLVMSSPVSTLREDEDILDATKQMMVQSVRRLAVVDEYEPLFGSRQR